MFFLPGVTQAYHPSCSFTLQRPPHSSLCPARHSQPVAVWWPCHQQQQSLAGRTVGATGGHCPSSDRAASKAASRSAATPAGQQAQGAVEWSGEDGPWLEAPHLCWPGRCLLTPEGLEQFGCKLECLSEVLLGRGNWMQAVAVNVGLSSMHVNQCTTPTLHRPCTALHVVASSFQIHQMIFADK
jgi:hypothetical protein